MNFILMMKITGVVIVLSGIASVVQSNPNTKVSSVLCNSGVFTEGDPFVISLAYVVADLEALTPTRQGYHYKNISPYPNAFAYGHASCNNNNNLTAADCTTCLKAAKTTMSATCDRRIGARSVLFDCKIRYEQYPFDD